MRKAIFFRKCINANDYLSLLIDEPILGQEMNYKIVWIIKCDLEQYQKFQDDFLKDDPIIKKIKSKLYIEDNCVHVALCTYDYKEGWLIYPSGYNYARYIAKWDGGDKIV